MAKVYGFRRLPPHPHQYAEGFSWVIVNGQVVYEAGRMTPARGRVLYGPAHRSGASR